MPGRANGPCRHHSTQTMLLAMSTQRARGLLDDLEHQLDAWVGRELITREQANRILDEERGPEQAARQGSICPLQPADLGGPAASPATARGVEPANLVTEALGYVGGILILIAAGLIAGQYFDDLGRAGRLAVIGAAGLALFGGGYLVQVVPGRAATGRLRSVLWVLTVAAVAAFLGLLADESFGWTDEKGAFLAASGAALAGLALWRWHRWLLQQVAVVVALAVALGSGVSAFLGEGEVALSGLAIWGLGAVWLMLGWGRHVRPRYVTDLLGGVTVTIGSLLTMEYDQGAALAMATAAGLVFTGVRLRALALLGVGSIATLSVVPAVMQRYFPDTIAAPLALLAAGVLLVVAALATASRVRHGEHLSAEPAPLHGMGWMSIVGIALTVALTVVVISQL